MMYTVAICISVTADLSWCQITHHWEGKINMSILINYPNKRYEKINYLLNL